MYWYPFNEQEENKAWGQAEAQASDAGNGGGTEQMKAIGNLGEIAVEQYLSHFADRVDWDYRHAEAMEKAEPEWGTVDFNIGRYSVDVKSTTDIRKFDPLEMYHSPSPMNETGEPIPLTVASDGYPKVKTSDAEVFVFVLISKAQYPTPEEERLEETIEGVDTDDAIGAFKLLAERLEERSGDYVAAILGWMYSKEVRSEAIEHANDTSMGKFTRMMLRDMNELLTHSNPVG